jgi:FkbH-like protein
MSMAPLPGALTLRILRNFTVEHIEPALTALGKQYGWEIQLQFGGFDSIVQDILSLPRAGESGAPDIIVVALHLETFAGGLHTPQWSVTAAKAALQNIFDLLERHCSSLVIVNTFVPPFFIRLPAMGAGALGGRAEAVRELNEFVRSIVVGKPERLALVDWEVLALSLGERETMDYRFGYMMKAPFKKAFLESYAREIVRIVRCQRGTPRKVLTVDCDNTLWGGVVGEDGLEGLALDPFTYPGVAYHRLQFDLLTLREQGVLLCLCSKNNPEDVWEVLKGHPHCLLKREHLTAWRINWEDKAKNIEELAAELNLGLDSFVFLDDNPSECERVRQALPQVAVVPIPERLFELPGFIIRQGLFDSLHVSSEDRKRARFYHEAQQRETERESHQTIEAYLASLQIIADTHEMRPEEQARAAQLTNRTNQFNLTTRRYSQADIARFAVDPATRIFVLEVADKFGELGLVGLLIYQRCEQVITVDTFLLSCRVIGRKLEEAFLAQTLEAVDRTWGATTIRAAYVPTPKNFVVADLWPAFGFKEIGNGKEGRVFEAARSELSISMPHFIRTR